MKHGNAALALAGLFLATAGFAAGWTARGGSQPIVESRPAALAPAASAPAATAATDPDVPAEATPPPAAALSEPPRAGVQRNVTVYVPPEAEPTAAPRKSQEELLASAGFTAARARELRERSERFEQAREYLDKDARREEAAAVLELNRAQKKEIGEEAYGYMLWSAGIPNRVLVRDVFEGSTASRVGLQRGDVLLRYDGERIFETDELSFLVREPSDRARAELEVLRNGELIELSVPRGVLGVSVGSSFDPPREDLQARRVRRPVVSADKITVEGDRMTAEGNVRVEPAESSDR
jgi:hypothetical protein